MQKLEYEESYLKTKMERIRRKQMDGKLLVEIYNRECGLPCLIDMGVSVIAGSFGSGHQYEIRTKDTPPVALGYANYDSDAGVHVFVPSPDAVLPSALANYHLTQLGEVVLDEASRTATILRGEELITLTDVEIWHENHSLLSEINLALSKANENIMVWKLKRVPDNSGKPKLYAGRTPTVSNNQVSLAVSGFAVNDRGSLAYMGVIGHKTAVNSVWATLLQSKPMTIFGAGLDNTTLLTESSRYLRALSPMPDYDSHHCAFISNVAVPGKWMPEDTSIFLLHFFNGENIESQLVKRLNESLAIPVLPEWGDCLMKTGALKGYIKSLKTGGYCLDGVSIDVEADWNQLVEDLILAEELAI